MRKISVLLLLFITCFTGYTQKISPYLFGQNAWMPSWFYSGHLDKIWRHAQPGNFKIIRIGGITYEDNFDPHIDDFIRFVDSIRMVCHAEPVLQVPRTYTVQQTNELYNYINVVKNKNVKYWSIGNEPDYHNKNTMAETTAYFVRIARALKDNDSSLVISGPDYANFWVHPGDVYDAGKTQYTNYIKAVGTEMNTKQTAYLLDVFTFHNYVGYTIDKVNDNQDIERVLDNINTTLKEINAKRTKGLKNKASWGIGEFNISADGSPQRTRWSFYAGQYFAMIFGVGMKKEAAYITPWSLIEGEYRKSSDLSMFENAANQYKPRSTFYHTKMLSDNYRENYMNTTSTQGAVKTIGMKDENGYTLMVLNTSETISYKTKISLDIKSGISDELAIKADGGKNIEHSTQIPPNSTNTFIFDNQGHFVKKISYTKSDTDNFKPPVESTDPLLGSETLKKSSLLVYPTVTSDYLFVKNSESRYPLTIKIADMTGRICLEKQINSEKLDVSALANGIYQAIISDNGNVQTVRFIKQ